MVSLVVPSDEYFFIEIIFYSVDECMYLPIGKINSFCLFFVIQKKHSFAENKTAEPKK